MAVATMRGKPANPLARLFGGRRAGTVVMIGGAALAAAAFFMVLGLARASQSNASQTVPQVYVVTVARDIPQSTTIRADALAIKAFPAAFAPAGAASKIEDVDGKFAATNLMRDQIVLTSHASQTRLTSNLSAAIPPGKVAFWMAMPDLLARSGGIRAGDRIDVLLSLELSAAGRAGAGAAAQQVPGIATQNTLQNVEVFFVGSASNADLPSDAAASSKQGGSILAFLLDPQDALLTKYIKDSGGIVDLVLRSIESREVVATQSVNADTVMDRFQFRPPERWTIRR